MRARRKTSARNSLGIEVAVVRWLKRRTELVQSATNVVMHYELLCMILDMGICSHGKKRSVNGYGHSYLLNTKTATSRFLPTISVLSNNSCSVEPAGF